MDNKNLNHKKILFLIVIIIIIVLCLIFFWIKNWIEDSKNNQKKMEEIKETYQVLETDISNYNDTRTKLIEQLQEYYPEKLTEDYLNYTNLLTKQENNIEKMLITIKTLDKNCQKRIFSEKEVNTICKTYQENYETAVNIFLNDQNQVNILIKTYNETSTSPLEEFQSKKITEYIDYNQDGNYLEREEL